MSAHEHGDVTERPTTVSARAFSWLFLLLIAWMLWAARAALAPYIFAVLMIYILLPVVRWLERVVKGKGHFSRARRPIAAIVAAMIALLAIVIMIGSLVGPVIEQTREMLLSFDQYVEQAKANNPKTLSVYEEYVPLDLRVWIEQNAKEIGQELWAGLVSIATWLLQATGSALSSVLALISVPLFVIYYLIDEGETAGTLRRRFPGIWAEEGIAVFRIFDSVFGAYTRGVLLESLIVGVITGFGYWLIGVELFLPLAVVAFAGEILPIVGPWIAFFISFPVILATQPDLAIPAMLLFLVLQMIEGWVLSPMIHGNSSHFTSSGTLLILAIGGGLAGGLGAVLAIPTAGFLRGLGVYGFQRLDGQSADQALSRLYSLLPDSPMTHRTDAIDADLSSSAEVDV